MALTANGTFDIVMAPGSAELGGGAARIEFSKTWQGDLEGPGSGVMMSAGDPQAGEAGYVAVEIVSGRLEGRAGGFALQQFGTMHGGAQTQYYEVVPGSGSDELAGIAGTLRLTVDGEGVHHYALEYDV